MIRKKPLMFHFAIFCWFLKLCLCVIMFALLTQILCPITQWLISYAKFLYHVKQRDSFECDLNMAMSLDLVFFEDNFYDN